MLRLFVLPSPRLFSHDPAHNGQMSIARKLLWAYGAAALLTLIFQIWRRSGQCGDACALSFGARAWSGQSYGLGLGSFFSRDFSEMPGHRWEHKMKRILLLAPAALGALTISVNARDDRLPAKFVGNWCLAEHTADHLSFYRRGRCTNPDGVEDWLTISPDGFDAHEMHCQVLVARANKRGDYLIKFWCGDNLIQNYWFSLFNDRLYVSLTDREP